MTDNSKIFDEISSRTKLRTLYTERDELSDQLENIENYVATTNRQIAWHEDEVRRLREEVAEAQQYKAAELLPVFNGLLDNIDRVQRERAKS